VDPSSPIITYILLVIPTLFAAVVSLQGVYKISKEEKDGFVVLGFGVFFVVLIVAAYFFLIK